MSQKSSLIFCSASYDIDPRFNDVARDVVRALHAAGYSIVSGGTVKGTMGVVADEAHSLGAENIGVIPKFMECYVHPDLDKVIWTELMSERKDLMREYGKDLAIALPGGVGTMDELFETFTLAKLGKYDGRLIVVNCYGFYDKLEEFVDYLTQTRMLDEHTRTLISFPKSLEEFRKLL